MKTILCFLLLAILASSVTEAFFGLGGLGGIGGCNGCYALVSMYYQLDYADVVIGILSHSLFLEAMLSWIATLVFVTSYRKAVLNVFKRQKTMANTVSVASTTVFANGGINGLKP
ncbi:hypothetical protein QR680_016408 [Steinernema hermaphroditum]|uniref:7TM GPCR serpentine receptor class x (Srx) domain-containing protein n=1 Tax=Steinernema hermaphroditum TaxID=289476 RepID=A0AA39HBG4_9BILA|nr:hypothetical protein QR680_016408 [Steinernema hermaphroditum]